MFQSLAVLSSPPDKSLSSYSFNSRDNIKSLWPINELVQTPSSIEIIFITPEIHINEKLYLFDQH